MTRKFFHVPKLTFASQLKPPSRVPFLVYQQGSRVSPVVRVLTSLHPSPRLNSQSGCHMWVEFVIGSCPCSEGSSPCTKSNIPHSNSIWKQWTRRATAWNVCCKIPVIYHYYVVLLFAPKSPKMILTLSVVSLEADTR